MPRIHDAAARLSQGYPVPLPTASLIGKYTGGGLGPARCDISRWETKTGNGSAAQRRDETKHEMETKFPAREPWKSADRCNIPYELQTGHAQLEHWLSTSTLCFGRNQLYGGGVVYRRVRRSARSPVLPPAAVLETSSHHIVCPIRRTLRGHQSHRAIPPTSKKCPALCFNYDMPPGKSVGADRAIAHAAGHGQPTSPLHRRRLSGTNTPPGLSCVGLLVAAAGVEVSWQAARMLLVLML